MKFVFLILFFSLSAKSSEEKVIFYFSSTSEQCVYETRLVDMGLNRLFDRIVAEFKGKTELKCFPAARMKTVMRESQEHWLTWGALSWYPDLDLKYEKALPIYKYGHRIAVKNKQESLSDLKGSSIATIRGYTFPKEFYDRMKKLGIAIEYVQSTDSCLGMVIYGRVGGCLDGSYELKEAAMKLKSKENISYFTAFDVLPEENVYILFGKKITPETFSRITKVTKAYLDELPPPTTCCKP